MPALALKRKNDQSILIGDGIKVTVTDICGGSCRVIVTAPAHITVLREELLDQGRGKESPLAKEGRKDAINVSKDWPENMIEE